jgi:hypothetical protein
MGYSMPFNQTITLTLNFYFLLHPRDPSIWVDMEKDAASHVLLSLMTFRRIGEVLKVGDKARDYGG